MRIGGQRKFNCLLSVPTYGDFPVVATTLGYGMTVVANVGEARAARTFYPDVRTSGPWYVDTAHGNREERDEMNSWLYMMLRRASNPWTDRPISPITVTIPARDFVKTGYPTGSLNFGDSTGKSDWNSRITFSSASDPTTSILDASRYVAAKNSDAAKNFYPGSRISDQSNTAVPPVDPVAIEKDNVIYGNGYQPPLAGGTP